jgi:hypothetical protein
VIEEGLGQPWPDEVRAAVRPFLQGHLIEKPPLFFAADLRHPVWQTTRLAADLTPAEDRGEDFVEVLAEQRPAYGIITTQSCDLAEERPDPRQPWLAVAPVDQVDPHSALLDRDYIYRLTPLTLGGEVWVADLRIELPLEKSLLVGRMPIDAFPDERGYIQFARFLARRRGRPALASVVHEVLSGVTRRLKDEDNGQRRLARAARRNIYKLKLAIEDGSFLDPVAAKLYVVTAGDPTDETRAWFDLWWNAARRVAEERGLQLLPTGWMNAAAVDARLYDELIEMRSPV